ncbi:hypothetical protein B0F90DRAFT_1938574 [Multifurca ochricompacta]|uniref:Endoplasmic reticulum junction formation protein lunapark n=1 Tax=Multifurca ochricompacta TaxID=376703 RepID=A0AAD4QKS3_9AGAM|nr:hypothetical protein B0F90DRAFT_1938574 [Multifurca ochricompacta]
MGLFSWFQKKESEDFGQILAKLALDVQKRETRLNEIRLRERRATLLVTMYTFAGWGAYLALWYTQLLPQMSRHRPNSQVERAIKGFPAILGPIIILFTRRIVQLWYNRKGNAEEKSLAALKLARRNKVEEIKKKTNYYETRELLELYEDGPSTRLPTWPKGSGPPSRLQPQQPPVTPQRAMPAVPPNTPANLRAPISPGLQSQLAPSPQQPLPPPRKLWYDKLADALLGDEEPSANVAASRYALICQKCFTHNGLVKEDMWEDAQYVCPRCGHFNPSARSQRKGPQPQPQPQSPATPQTPPKPELRGASPLGARHSPNGVDGSPASGGGNIMDVD